MQVVRLADGTTLRTRITGDRDPGYGSTAKILGEAGACLAQDISRTDPGGGFWTPATALGDALLARLEREAKVVAAAVVNLLNDRDPGTPSWVNTCYSIVTPEDGFSVAMVYKLGEDGKVMKVAGSGGLTPLDSSPSDRAREVQYAYSWFNNITRDIFG